MPQYATDHPILSLDPEDAPMWAQAEEIEDTSLEALTHHPKILAAVADHVDRVNSELASYESLKYWDIVGIPFLPENGYLTPTLKLKRRAILADFGDRIENIYLQATSEALSPVERT